MVEITVRTHQRSQMVDITAEIQQAVTRSGFRSGALLVYCPHTTAAVTINENADPSVAQDILESLERQVPWQGPYRHAEGNAAAHVRAVLVGPSVLVPVVDGRLRLGRWQGIFLCEFDGPRTRTLWLVPLTGAA